MSEDWKIVIQPQARLDLRAIHNYIAFQLSEPGIAVKQLQNIRKVIYSLLSSPKRRLVDFEPWRSRGIRRVNAGNYAVFFIAEEVTRTVSVIRIAYGRMDLQRLLEETDLESE